MKRSPSHDAHRHHTRSPSPTQSRGRKSRLDRSSRSSGRTAGYNRVIKSPTDFRYSHYQEQLSCNRDRDVNSIRDRDINCTRDRNINCTRDRDVNNQSYQHSNNFSDGCDSFSPESCDKPEYLNPDQFQTGQDHHHPPPQYDGINRDYDTSFHECPNNQYFQDNNLLKEERFIKR